MNPQHIVESLNWDGFLIPSLNVPNRIRAIRELLTGGVSAQQLCERGVVKNALAAAQFKGRVANISEVLDSLRRHTSRSNKRYIGLLVQEGCKAFDRFLRNPSHSTFCIMEQYGDFAKESLKELQNGTYNDGATQLFLEKMNEIEIPSDVYGILHLYEAQESDRHQRFVSALEREFGITVHRHEPVSEGVFVYMDATATDAMWEQLKSVPDILNRISDKHGYLTLRRGSRGDIEWGSFPESYSKWMFVYCPATEAGDIGDCETIATTDYKPVKFITGGKSQLPLRS